MKKGNEQMFPIVTLDAVAKGITKREHFAICILQAMVQNPTTKLDTISMTKVVDMCDELLTELEK